MTTVLYPTTKTTVSGFGYRANGSSVDLNNDGYMDVLLASGFSNTAGIDSPIYGYTYNAVTHNYDAFTFTINGVVANPTAIFAMYVATYDINKDGIADIVPMDENENDANNDGTFDGNHQYAYISNGIGNYTKVDLGFGTVVTHGWGFIESADGKVRIIENTPWSGANVDVPAACIATYNSTTGQFESQLLLRDNPYFTSAPQGHYWNNYFYQFTTDINNDGNTDIVAMSSVGGINNIYMNNGYGSFTYSKSIDAGLAVNINVEEVAVGDFNGDGFKDFVCEAVNRADWSEYKTLRVLINDQNGGFTDQTTQWIGNVFQNTNTSYGYMDTFDFNNDGKSDFVFTHQATQTNGGATTVDAFVSNGTSFTQYSLDSELSVDAFGNANVGSRIIPLTNNSFLFNKDFGDAYNAVATLELIDDSLIPVVTPVTPTPPITPVVDPVTPITPVDPVVTPVDPYTNFTKFNGAATVVDKLTGTTGDDYLDGGAGKDIMKGGAGNDVYVVDNIKDSVTEKANEGTDKVLAGVNYTLKANFENLELTGTALNGTGNKVANEITGNELDNVLKGIDGNDTLTGGAGNDKLFGGKGNDNLTGGAGNDIFVFDTKGTATIANIDEILDFSAGDTLQFKKGVFGKAGAVLADDFVSEAGAVAHDKTDHFMFDTNSGNLYYDVDGSGAKSAIQVAHLVGVTDLHSTDLFLV